MPTRIKNQQQQQETKNKKEHLSPLWELSHAVQFLLKTMSYYQSAVRLYPFFKIRGTGMVHFTKVSITNS